VIQWVFSVVFQWFFSGVSVVFQWCFSGFSVVLCRKPMAEQMDSLKDEKLMQERFQREISQIKLP
jgi:hypothetical protein